HQVQATAHLEGGRRRVVLVLEVVAATEQPAERRPLVEWCRLHVAAHHVRRGGDVGVSRPVHLTSSCGRRHFILAAAGSGSGRGPSRAKLAAKPGSTRGAGAPPVRRAACAGAPGPRRPVGPSYGLPPGLGGAGPRTAISGPAAPPPHNPARSAF